MIKLKPVLPSLREKKRYLAFKIISKNKNLDQNSVWNAISNGINAFLGDLGASYAGIQFLKDKWNPGNNTGIIRTNHKYLDQVRAALILTRKINDQEIIIKSTGASGILKKAEKYLAS